MGADRPTITDAEAWRPEWLREAADSWDLAATDLHAHVDAVVGGVHASRDFWTGSAADRARQHASALGETSESLARALVLAAAAAREGAVDIADARRVVLDAVAEARAEGLAVADDGTVTAADPSALLLSLSGGDSSAAREMLRLRAIELSRHIVTGLAALGVADAEAAHRIDQAFACASSSATDTRPASTESDAVAALTPQQRRGLIRQFPEQVGNTDGVPWDMRIAANRLNIAQAILDERRSNRPAPERITLYEHLLDSDRQVLAFDRQRASLIELFGDIDTAKSVGVLVPGLNTTVEDSASDAATAARFVAAGHGDVAMITYLGGRFPTGWGPHGVVDAANPRYALDMAPRLAAFSEDVDRRVDATGRAIPVTYIGHSYGGSILGTAEEFGLTADRTLYVEAAGAGVGVDEPGDWHNRNPNVLRFSMTAPGDPIEAVQGIPFGPHGADPDEMAGVIRLETGRYDDGRLMAGLPAHSDVLNQPSDAWDNVLSVITGGDLTLYQDRLFAWAG